MNLYGQRKDIHLEQLQRGVTKPEAGIYAVVWFKMDATWSQNESERQGRA